MNICKKEHKNSQGIWEKCAVSALLLLFSSLWGRLCSTDALFAQHLLRALQNHFCTTTLRVYNDRWKYHAPASLCPTARAPSPSSHCLHHNLHPREGSSLPRQLYFTPSQTISPLWAFADNDLSRVWDNPKPLGSSQLLLLMVLEAISWLVF